MAKTYGESPRFLSSFLSAATLSFSHVRVSSTDETKDLRGTVRGMRETAARNMEERTKKDDITWSSGTESDVVHSELGTRLYLVGFTPITVTRGCGRLASALSKDLLPFTTTDCVTISDICLVFSSRRLPNTPKQTLFKNMTLAP